MYVVWIEEFNAKMASWKRDKAEIGNENGC